MKRLAALLLCFSIFLSTFVFSVSAEGDVLIDSPEAVFPADTTVSGDLILSGDCPQTVVLINVIIEGTLRIDADHPVTVYLQGDSKCDNAEILSRATLNGGTYGEIYVETPHITLRNTEVEKLELACKDGVATVGGNVERLILSNTGIFAGGSGRAELAIVNYSGCTVNLRCGKLEKNAADPVDTDSPSSAVKASFVINPTVSPANSVVHAKVTFTHVPDIYEGDYRIYWYIGDTLSYYDWHYDLKSGATAELDCSVHFNDDTEEVLPVWVKLVHNDTEMELRFVSKVNVLSYDIGDFEGYDHPFSVHLLRNQNVILIYGKDENGEYTKLVNAFLCSTGYWNETEVGDFEIGLQMRWGSLMLDLWGQYSSQFNYNQLFHSVPYWSPDLNNIEWEEYEKLGTAASSGCVRLCVADAKWIYDHCHTGAPVKVYDVEELPVEKPIQCVIREDSLNRGWDPTDPDPDNPTRAEDPPVLTAMLVRNDHPLYHTYIN